MRTERVLEGIAGRSGSFNTVAFSADGTSVFAGGRYVDNAGIIQIRRWSMTGAPAADIPVAMPYPTLHPFPQ